MSTLDVVIPGATCSCGARLHAVSSSDGDDWLWLDESGEMFEDRHPPGYRADPLGWWERLMRKDIAAYSAWSARFALGMTGWTHRHWPAQQEPFEGDVPWCCKMPMRLTPRGWLCREVWHEL